jgi:hypothetical protein
VRGEWWLSERRRGGEDGKGEAAEPKASGGGAGHPWADLGSKGRGPREGDEGGQLSWM